MTNATAPPLLSRWIYWTPLLPTGLLLAYLAFRRMGMLPAEPTPPALALLWAFATLSMIPLPFAIRMLVRNHEAYALRMDAESGEALLVHLQAASAEVARATQAIESFSSGLSHAEPQDNLHPPTTRSKILTSFVLLSLGFAVTAAAVTVGFANMPAVAEIPHIHATFAVFVEGHRVEYADVAFDIAQRRVLAAHLHHPNQDLLHLEGRPGITLAEAFAFSTGGQLSLGRLQLDEVAHRGATYESNATHTVRVYVSPAFSSDWLQVEEFASYQPRDGDQILITYGSNDVEELQRQMNEVAALP